MMWVVTQLYGRNMIAKRCLAQLQSVLPPHAELHIWDDHSPEPTGWAASHGTMHREPQHLGIEELRVRQIRAAAAAGVDEIYLTDTDAMHDPGWYAQAVKLYAHGAPVCLYNSRHHLRNTITEAPDHIVRRHASGISWYMRKKELQQLNPRVRKSAGWDWHFATILGNRCIVSKESYVEHYGADGIHNKTWDFDTALQPTPFLRDQRAHLLQEFGATGPLGLLRMLQEHVDDAPRPMVIINQPRGIGDIIFMLKAVEWIRDMGYRAVWAVEPAFMSIGKHAPWVTFVPYTSLAYTSAGCDSVRELLHNGAIIAPFRWSDTYMAVKYCHVMPAKYAMLGLDWHTWSTAGWERDSAAEERLVAALKLPPKFALVNRRFTSTGRSQIALPPMRMPVVEQTVLQGFSAIDWVGVAERATEIHTVGTGTVFAIDALAAHLTPNLFLYPRKPAERDCGNYDYLLTRPWKVVL